MCLVIPEKKKIKDLVKVTEKDLIVYKRVKIVSATEVISILHDFVYVKDKLNKARICYSKPDRTTFNSEADEKVVYQAINKLNLSKGEIFNYCTAIGKGFHSYKNRVTNSNLTSNAEFLIPKGSKYIEFNRIIVSNRIIFKKLLI